MSFVPYIVGIPVAAVCGPPLVIDNYSHKKPFRYTRNILGAVPIVGSAVGTVGTVGHCTLFGAKGKQTREEAELHKQNCSDDVMMKRTRFRAIKLTQSACEISGVLVPVFWTGRGIYLLATREARAEKKAQKEERRITTTITNNNTPLSLKDKSVIRIDLNCVTRDIEGFGINNRIITIPNFVKQLTTQNEKTFFESNEIVIELFSYVENLDQHTSIDNQKMLIEKLRTSLESNNIFNFKIITSDGIEFTSEAVPKTKSAKA